MRLTALVLLAVLPLAAAQRDKWNVAYLYDEDQSALALRAIEFPSDQRGIAIGMLNEKGRPRPVALVTADGGKTWDQVRLKDEPLALACYTDEVCWISTGRGVWRSDEGGRDWKKVSDTKGILRMQFTSANEGFAAGVRKSAWDTKDGGKTWNLLPAAKALDSNPDTAQFTSIAFTGALGIIAGNSRPHRRDESLFPDWMVPEEAAKRREFPATMIMLETRDAGKTWTSSKSAVFGTVTALRMQPEGVGAIALLEYFQSFETPSEVLMVSFKSGHSDSIFRAKNTAITDVYPGPNGAVLLAGVESTGLRGLPIPQKLRFMEGTFSSGSSSTFWTGHDVDYRATATRVALTRKPNGQFWAVTDTGIILRLDRAVAMAK